MLASIHVMSVAMLTRREGVRDVASGGEVTAALNETSARRRCHNVAGGRNQWGVRGVCGARWLYMIEDNGWGASGFADLTLGPEIGHGVFGLCYWGPHT